MTAAAATRTGPEVTRADLDAATSATAAINPEADLMGHYRAVQLEAALYEAAPEALVVQAEAETEAELEL